jgi:ribosome-associated protein
MEKGKGRSTRRKSLKGSAIITLTIRGEHMTLAQAVKAAGFADTGGQAKHLVRGGTVEVNSTVETKPGRKLYPGDRFRVQGGAEWTTISR